MARNSTLRGDGGRGIGKGRRPETQQIRGAHRHVLRIKRIRTNEERRLRNKSVRSAVRTEIRKLREAVDAGDKAAAEAQLRVASRALDKAVSKGVFHRNNAANKKSNMASAVNKMG